VLSPTIGFGLPQLVDPATPTEPVAGLASSAEAAGYHALWTMEVMRARMLDPLPLLAHAAAVTERIDLGVAILLLPLRVPAQLARQLATVDHLSNGRLIAGLGLGNKNESLYAEHGVPTSARLQRYLGGIRALKDLLTDGTTEFEGTEWTFSQQTGIPQPVSRPHPRLWLAGRSEAAVRRAAQEADGFVGSGSGGYEEFLSWLPVLEDELGRLGRDRSTFTIASRVYVLVDPTPESRRRSGDWFAKVYGNAELADRAALAGDADAIAERVASLAARGVDHVILNPVLDYRRHLDGFAADVLPRFPID
jgi:alkanesulfonate monooxygenase SsuD/methylene tetrahydromethanopterin reductase-like flavin-dependent oxidoreductase (luciferase family)